LLIVSTGEMIFEPLRAHNESAFWRVFCSLKTIDHGRLTIIHCSLSSVHRLRSNTQTYFKHIVTFIIEHKCYNANHTPTLITDHWYLNVICPPSRPYRIFDARWFL